MVNAIDLAPRYVLYGARGLKHLIWRRRVGGRGGWPFALPQGQSHRARRCVFAVSFFFFLSRIFSLAILSAMSYALAGAECTLPGARLKHRHLRQVWRAPTRSLGDV
eukprot:2987067-Rhodomonas_salina.1